MAKLLTTTMHCRQRHSTAMIAVALTLLAMAADTDAFFSAQYAETTFRNEMGGGATIQLACFRRVQNIYSSEKKWVKIFDLNLGDGQGYTMYHPGLPFVQEKIGCNIRANWKGKTCSWINFDDNADSADADGDDRTWYFRRDGIHDEITSGKFKRGFAYRYRYCAGFNGDEASARMPHDHKTQDMLPTIFT